MNAQNQNATRSECCFALTIIDLCFICSSGSDKREMLRAIAKKLPKANYDNLKWVAGNVSPITSSLHSFINQTMNQKNIFKLLERLIAQQLSEDNIEAGHPVRGNYDA